MISRRCPLRPEGKSPSEGDPSLVRFVYRDEGGSAVFHGETGPDGNLVYRRTTTNGNPVGIQGAKLIPYRLPELSKADPEETVWIVRDEAEADALAARGLIATCGPTTNYWLDSDMTPHVDGRRLVIVGRADDVGREQSEAIARAVSGAAAEVKIIEPAGLKPRMSLVQWFDLEGGIDLLIGETADTEPFMPVELRVVSLDPAERHENNQDSVFDGMSDSDLGIVSADKVDPEEVDWEWKNRIACGKLGLLAGEGGDGKSQAAIAVAAAITTAGLFPDGSGLATKGVCLILAAEDGQRDTIIPRLIAAGADRSLVKILTARVTTVKDGKKSISPMSFQDLAYWRAIFKRSDARLMIADPLPAFWGEASTTTVMLKSARCSSRLLRSWRRWKSPSWG